MNLIHENIAKIVIWLNYINSITLKLKEIDIYQGMWIRWNDIFLYKLIVWNQNQEKIVILLLRDMNLIFDILKNIRYE